MRYQLYKDAVFFWIYETETNTRGVKVAHRIGKRLFDKDNGLQFKYCNHQSEVLVAEANTLEELKLSVPWLFL